MSFTSTSSTTSTSTPRSDNHKKRDLKRKWSESITLHLADRSFDLNDVIKTSDDKYIVASHRLWADSEYLRNWRCQENDESDGRIVSMDSICMAPVESETLLMFEYILERVPMDINEHSDYRKVATCNSALERWMGQLNIVQIIWLYLEAHKMLCNIVCRWLQAYVVAGPLENIMLDDCAAMLCSSDIVTDKDLHLSASQCGQLLDYYRQRFLTPSQVLRKSGDKMVVVEAPATPQHA